MLSFHCLGCFGCVWICIFSFHCKQSASDCYFSFLKFTSQMFSNVNESKTKLVATALKWFASGFAHFGFIHITSVVKPVHIFVVRNRISKSCLLTEPCFHCFKHFGCVLIYIFSFHHKQCATLLWSLPLRCWVVLLSPWRIKRICYFSEMVR